MSPRPHLVAGPSRFLAPRLGRRRVDDDGAPLAALLLLPVSAGPFGLARLLVLRRLLLLRRLLPPPLLLLLLLVLLALRPRCLKIPVLQAGGGGCAR